jgi:hypothetical protein
VLAFEQRWATVLGMGFPFSFLPLVSYVDECCSHGVDLDVDVLFSLCSFLLHKRR